MPALYLTALLLALAVPGARAYSRGAPVGQCNEMMPGHGVASQPVNDAPYAVTTSKNTYYAGETIMVTVAVNGTTNFKGLLLRAAPETGNNNTAVGSFSVPVVTGNPPLQLLECSSMANSGVTHTNNDNKTAVMVNWTAPSTGSVNVVFRVTVVQEFNTFFVGITSSPLRYMMKPQMTTSATNNPNSGKNTGTGIAGSVAIVFVALLLNRLA